ncbi:hypothetical protein QBC32DRAFT_377452 [Pseudoneurospora amorphoporcata]|uniref:Uncharacterized protein n=1 Tax=Pseudoneurospora amorphoporcata TaxID=241081 RepID=A0AAN6NPZ8_9PEZI|nr:hypothetical protein QBC32DRAFT_377452 [Pseudoneurospora amorphoporcata]
MSYLRGQLHILGLHGSLPLASRMATNFPVTLAAIPVDLIRAWITQKSNPSILRTRLHHGLGNLWASVTATLTRWISTFEFGLSRLNLIRPPAPPLHIPEPPPTETMILVRLVEDFDGQRFVRRISEQAYFDRNDLPHVRESRSPAATFEVYDLEYNLIFSSVAARMPVGGGLPFLPRMPWWRTPSELKRASQESRLVFTTDGQFIYVYSDTTYVDYGEFLTWISEKTLPEKNRAGIIGDG